MAPHAATNARSKTPAAFAREMAHAGVPRHEVQDLAEARFGLLARESEAAMRAYDDFRRQLEATNPHGVDVPPVIRQAVEDALIAAYGTAGIAHLCWHEPEDGQVAQFATEGPLFGDFHFHNGPKGLERATEVMDDMAARAGGKAHVECITSAWFGIHREA